ncbi:MAG: hypothetical protein DRJ31_03080 [Candidatus Methanomethylicota archaeon]|uniref:Uncharacterized protein n=1 Tax=Thermoproteota archaeon TaxID=2056631 RepID=A0A497ETL7_9CREN|nr:MAG: hypothetical protein DRJ31_03080 [Candidatus Verstraetearchaeota archaeon]
MLKLIEEKIEFNGKVYHITILSLKNVDGSKALELLDRLKRHEHGVVIQAFNPELIATHQHLLSAFIHALKAFKETRNISKNLSMEMVLYAAFTSQIKQAIELIGIKQGARDVVFFIASEDQKLTKEIVTTVFNSFKEGLLEDDSILEINREKALKMLEIMKLKEHLCDELYKGEELNNLVIKSVLERVAEVDLLK